MIAGVAVLAWWAFGVLPMLELLEGAAEGAKAEGAIHADGAVLILASGWPIVLPALGVWRAWREVFGRGGRGGAS